MTGIGVRVEPPFMEQPKTCDCCGTSRNLKTKVMPDGRVVTLCLGCWADPSLAYKDCKHGRGAQ